MRSCLKFFRVLLLLCSSCAVHPVFAIDLPGIPEFIDEMVVKHHFKRAELEKAFDRAQFVPAVIDAISRPATSRPWVDYRASFVNPERIRLGVKFWNKYRRALQYAERKYGVPQEIILGVIGVETVYGRNAGTFRILDALTTLAFAYPPRADYFRSELENFLLLAREQQLDLLSVRGSYAGALGIPQFMPSSYRAIAVDANGNRRIDLMHETSDAIYSVANYLKQYGWDSSLHSDTGEVHGKGKQTPVAVPVKVSVSVCVGEIITPRPVSAWMEAGITAEAGLEYVEDATARLVDFTVEDGKEFWLVFSNFDVIKSYNNSDYYAMTVLQLAEAVREARSANSRDKPRFNPAVGTRVKM